MAHAAWHPQWVAAPRAAVRRWRILARCGRACAASRAPSKRAACHGSTADARQRSCPQNASPLECALQPVVEVVVGLVAAPVVESAAAEPDAVPSQARRARSYRCETHMSACRCKNVLWSCLCSAMKMCVGVCTVGARARVLARARVCVLRRGCWTSLLAQETARPFPSCATTGPAPRARGHPPWRTVHRTFLLPCAIQCIRTIMPVAFAATTYVVHVLI